ncbi:uncharacterized protein LOC117900909 [Drosophila subobscura]|uniref:uncharacterized protein LOC117900909 n=1 Tax=Drosophila subobscura TaxID=7241 RepID=UPI00155A42D4|nr:uncharacterized protein LOC117900909 [Drosophila subobscura]
MVCRFNPFYVGPTPPTCCTSETINSCDCPPCSPDTGYQEPRCQCDSCCPGTMDCAVKCEKAAKPEAKAAAASVKGFSKCTPTAKTTMCNPACSEAVKK